MGPAAAVAVVRRHRHAAADEASSTPQPPQQQEDHAGEAFVDRHVAAAVVAACAVMAVRVGCHHYY